MCFDHFTLTVSQLATYIDSTYGLCLKTRSCWGKWWSYLKAACVYMQGLNLSLLGLLVGINRGNSPHNLNLIMFNSSYISCPQFRLVTQPPRHELPSNDIIQTAVGSSRVGRNVHVSLEIAWISDSISHFTTEVSSNWCQRVCEVAIVGSQLNKIHCTLEQTIKIILKEMHTVQKALQILNIARVANSGNFIGGLQG